KKSQTYTTAADNQTAVTIKVCQGEREIAGDNKLLGLFNLEGIAPAPRGMPQVEVTFDIDANGIMHVHAKDKGTNKETSIRIESGSGLSKDEIDRMQKEAEEHADEDKKRRETIEDRNRADTLVYSTEKALKEHGDAIDDSSRKEIEDAVAALKKALEGSDMEAIKKAEEEVAQKSQKLGEIIYKKMQEESSPEGDAGKQAEGATSSAEQKKGDDVVDAEVVDDKK
ncbi:MAG: Hsp70 family protein, partial [Mariprofundaceae bacterium]